MRASGERDVGELLVGERGDLDADVAQQRFVDEVLAVEQDVHGVTAASRGVVAPRCATVRARSRNRFTIAFCRLLIRSIVAAYY